MEQEVRELLGSVLRALLGHYQLLEAYVAERRSILEQIERAWATQPRRPTAKQIESWIAAGRE